MAQPAPAPAEFPKCPNCKVTRYKACWRPSQWAAKKAVTHGYIQCKVCDGEKDEPGGSRPANPPTMPAPCAAGLAELHRTMPEWELGGFPAEAESLFSVTRHAMATNVEKFVKMWMEELPRKTRKDYSYNGAIRCRVKADPRHYRCSDTGTQYFDPGNWLYAIALSALVPVCCKQEQWNIETKGDIFEAVMGFSYLKDHCTRHNMSTETFKYADEARRVADLFNEVDQLIPWVNWVMSNVYFAKCGVYICDDMLEVEADRPLEQLELKERKNSLLVKLTTNSE
jgi:hypothetical protein